MRDGRGLRRLKMYSFDEVPSFSITHEALPADWFLC